MLETVNKKIANLPNLDRQAFVGNVPMYLGKSVASSVESSISPRVSPNLVSVKANSIKK